MPEDDNSYVQLKAKKDKAKLQLQTRNVYADDAINAVLKSTINNPGDLVNPDIFIDDPDHPETAVKAREKAAKEAKKAMNEYVAGRFQMDVDNTDPNALQNYLGDEFRYNDLIGATFGFTPTDITTYLNDVKGDFSKEGFYKHAEEGINAQSARTMNTAFAVLRDDDNTKKAFATDLGYNPDVVGDKLANLDRRTLVELIKTMETTPVTQIRKALEKAPYNFPKIDLN